MVRQAYVVVDVLSPAHVEKYFAAAEAIDATPRDEATYPPPPVEQRKVVASRLRWPAFAPVLAAAGFACGRCILFALSSVTMMSPCCSAVALSSTDFKASAQLCPGALQEQDGLYSVR